MEVAQGREPPAISRKREWRAIEQGRAMRLAHDLHALAWGIELHRLVGEAATDHWRTPRYATGRYPVPHVGTGRNRHPLALNDIELPYKQAILDLDQKAFAEIKPDLSLELRFPSIQLTFDLLIEVVCEDDDHLLEILGRVRAVPCVSGTETFVYLKLRKQTYSWGTR